MKIELNVDGSQLDGEVKEILGNLSTEQKNQMAQDLLTKTLNNSESRMTKSIAVQKALEETNKKFDKKFTVNQKGELEGESSWHSPDHNQREFFKTKTTEYCDVGTYFKDYILKEMLDHGKTLIADTIKNSPVIADALAKATEEIKTEMPKIIHDAMVIYFASQMQNMMSGLGAALMQSGNSQQLLQSIEQKMSRHNIY